MLKTQAASPVYHLEGGVFGWYRAFGGEGFTGGLCSDAAIQQRITAVAMKHCCMSLQSPTRQPCRCGAGEYDTGNIGRTPNAAGKDTLL